MHEDQFASTTGPKGPPPQWAKKLARSVGWLGGTIGLWRILDSSSTSYAVPEEVKPMALALAFPDGSLCRRREDRGVHLPGPGPCDQAE